MTNKYSYNGSLLNTLITDMSSNVSTKFTGIGTNINVVDISSLKTLEKPMNLKYLIDSVDIANSCRAKYIEYNDGTDVELTTTGYTHFSAYLRGGSGGGGGSGGDGETNGGSNVNCNSTGGAGGSSGYVALNVNIPLNNNNLYISVGSMGNYGTKGADDNRQGHDGSDGNDGNAGGASYIKIGTNKNLICRANGGNGGSGSGGANSGGGGGTDGIAGTTGNGEFFNSYTGDSTYNSGNYPTITLSGGTGGNPDATGGVGISGNNGYVRIYLKKE